MHLEARLTEIIMYIEIDANDQQLIQFHHSGKNEGVSPNYYWFCITMKHP